MKRLGIFSYYDKDGVVDTYIEYILDNLICVVDDLIIAVNGKINVEGQVKFGKYTKHIIIRNNKGFDAGAYADIIINIIGKEELKRWDEIVLCNDTFYGPFKSFKDIFKSMNFSECDFWGLNYVENNILNHIQSYFLVFRNKIIQNGDLFEYFFSEINSEEEEISNVYAIFEVGLFNRMVSLGYKFDVYSNTKNYSIYDSADICIIKYGLPIWKKKTFHPDYLNLEQQIFIFQHIMYKTKYELNHILSSIKRQYGIYIKENKIIKYKNYISFENRKKEPVSCVTEKDIIKFLNNNKKIYIYGTGIIARKIWNIYCKHIDTFNGFIVSKRENDNCNLYGFPIKIYSEIPEEVAILVALNPQNTESIKYNLKNGDNVFFLW